MDGEFKKIKPEVELDINISAAREHVGEIEHYHHTLKERCRCVLSGMRPIGSDAYQYLHKQIVIQLVYFCVMMINMLGDKGCALRTLDKGISRGPNLFPLDKRITDRRAWIRTGIQTVQAVQCYILSS